MLPAGPRGFARIPGTPSNQPLPGSGVQVPPIGPRLGLPPERPPVGPGGSNIQGAPIIPRVPFVPGMQGAPRAPLTMPPVLPPHLGVSANPVGKIVSGGMPPASVPPVQLVGTGGPRGTYPLMDAAAVRPLPQQVS